jgi:hypothetical protein
MLEQVKKLYGHYETNGYVFTKCRGNRIAILKKTNTTTTDEGRIVADSKFALYTGSLFYVVLIFDMYEPHRTYQSAFQWYETNIQYFKSLEAAYYYKIENFAQYNGIHKEFDRNGMLVKECEYENGKLHGKLKRYDYGNLVYIDTYHRGNFKIGYAS